MKYSKKILDIVFVLPLVLASATIFYVSHQPNIKLPDLDFNFLDKVLHLIAYFIYGVATICAALVIFQKNRTRIIATLLFANIFAISDEFHQSFVPGRFFDVGDWIADSLGILLAIAMLSVVNKIYIYLQFPIKK